MSIKVKKLVAFYSRSPCIELISHQSVNDALKHCQPNQLSSPSCHILVMDKSKTALAGPSTPVTHVTWKRVKTTRGSRDKMVNIMPRKKIGYDQVNVDLSPTRLAYVSMEQPDYLLNNDEIQYPYLNNVCSLGHLKILTDQASIVIHVGHAGEPCPTGCDFTQEVTTKDEDEWEDVEEDKGPTHLRMWDFSNELLQQAPENYFQCFSTSCAISRMWRLLKLLKWQGFHSSFKDTGPGELVLFCLACPQPRVNISKEGIDLSQWKFARTLMINGNFKAKHMQQKDPSNEVWLMDGKDLMVESMPYKKYLKGTTNVGVVVPVQGMSALYHIQWQVNMDYALVHAVQHGLEPGQRQEPVLPAEGQPIYLHASWIDHSAQHLALACHVDGEIMETLWSSLNIISPLAQGMATSHWQEFLDFQMNDNNFLKMWSCATTEEAFATLDNNVPDAIQQVWIDQAERAFAEQASKPEAMDIFEVQLENAPTAKSIEMNLIYSQRPSQQWGLATWIAKALRIEQAQVQLMADSWRTDTRATETQMLSIAHWHDQLQSQINGLIKSAIWIVGDDWDNQYQQAPSATLVGGDTNDDVFMPTEPGSLPSIELFFHGLSRTKAETRPGQ
ncbi:hypothetical protein J3A83DRAFT_4190317 [Scleroderma citrinum]